MRSLPLVVLLLLSSAVEVRAQDWARKMFDALKHDFGTVASGAKVEHRFTITNLYKEDIQISSVRSSCGCTTPSVTVNTLKTHETSELVALFNTKTFQGDRRATLTVTFARPFYAEVQVHVSGHIRRDVNVNPGVVDLGTVQQGAPVEKKISITCNGRSEWKILDVQTANPYISAELKQTARSVGYVAYDLYVRLSGESPAGYVREQLLVVTNDQRSPQIPVEVEGLVEADISVAPKSVFFGVLKPGQKVTKQVVVRARKPFKLQASRCGHDAFSCDLSQEAKSVHVVPVTFVAPETVGKIADKVVIDSDLGPGAIPEIVVYAQVIDAK